MADKENEQSYLDTCVFCGNPATKLCDFPTGVIIPSTDFIPIRTTCSRPMCDDCAIEIEDADDVHFCPHCVKEFCSSLEERKYNKAAEWIPKRIRKNNRRKKNGGDNNG